MKAYRVWDPESGRVIRSRDVTFNYSIDYDMGEVNTDNFETTEDKNKILEQENGPTINQGGDNEQSEMIDSQDDENQEEPTVKKQNSSEETRRSTRMKKPTDRYGNWTSYLAFQKKNEEEDPDNTKFEAMAL